MAPILNSKQAQQDRYLRSLKEASPAEKAKIVLNNSGFAAAIHHNRQAVSVRFGR